MSTSYRLFVSFYFCSLFLFFISSISCQSSSKVLLRNIDSLVFSRHAKTTGRRSSPIPQMQCTAGQCHLSPATIFCKNVGIGENEDVNWECKATLPDGVKLGHVEVSCEGYDYPEDPYILKGSCGLEYTLEGSPASTSNHYYDSYHSSPYSSSTSTFFSSFVPILAFGFILLFIFRACSSPSAQFRGGSGGFGGYGPNDNPPPYGSGVYSSTASCAPSTSAASGSQSAAGFWTGLGLGGLGGYLMGRNTGRTGYGMRYGNGYGYGGGFGGGYRAAPTYSSGSSSSSSTSTSYGGTRRR